jgi:dGTPase
MDVLDPWLATLEQQQREREEWKASFNSRMELLKQERDALTAEVGEPATRAVEAFARDRARVVHSAALRRLSAKTQVVAPGSDDFIRTRLTHSLEVAQIGREFGAALGCDADVVDTACLAHDLGHPPFGHHGESVLDRLASSAGGFEGNAQTLRVLTRLEAKRTHPDGRPAGLNLTRASLDAVAKYPWPRGESPTGSSKFGVYAADLPVFAWFRSGATPAARCIEAQVMDWSDDVAYSVHDVEDAIASRRVDPRVLHDPAEVAVVAQVAHTAYAPDLQPGAFEEAAARLVATGTIPRSYSGTRADLAALKDLTSRLIGRFLLAVELATRERHGEGALTRFAADLVVPDDARAECSLLKAVAAHYVMHTHERRSLLGRQEEVVETLVAAYRRRPERLDPDLAADHAAAPDDAARLRVVVDQVASLTDARAVTLAQNLSG